MHNSRLHVFSLKALNLNIMSNSNFLSVQKYFFTLILHTRRSHKKTLLNVLRMICFGRPQRLENLGHVFVFAKPIKELDLELPRFGCKNTINSVLLGWDIGVDVLPPHKENTTIAYCRGFALHLIH